MISKGDMSMRRTYDTMEQAISIFNDRYGKEPTQREIIHLYHQYRNNWKPYDGFLDWLIYHEN